MKKLAVFAVAAALAASAFAGYGTWGDSTFSIGGATFSGSDGQLFGWAVDDGQGGTYNNPLGTLSDLTITQFAFNMWDEGQGCEGMNLNLTLWGESGQVGESISPWSGDDPSYFSKSHEDGSNNYAWNLTQPYDVASAMGAQLEDGKTYYLDVQIHTYGGDSGDFPQGSPDGKFHTEFTYQAGSAVPEPATMSLLGLGALAMVLRRKLRK